MITLAPLAPPRAPASRFNPVAKLGVLAVITLSLLFFSDPITPALMLAVELAVLPFTGVWLARMVMRMRLLIVAALGIVVVNTIYSDASGGTLLLDYGPFEIYTSNVATGLALGTRVAAIALPGILVFATTDPTDLADSLVQQLKVSHRFAVGSLAAFRLLPLLAQEWHMITMARRARGVDAGWNPIARLRLFASTMFALLVGAIRRGTRLAVAMDARGFDTSAPRSIARPVGMRTADWWLLAATASVCAAVITTSMAMRSL